MFTHSCHLDSLLGCPLQVMERTVSELLWLNMKGREISWPRSTKGSKGSNKAGKDNIFSMISG